MLNAFYQGYLLIVGICALFCLLVNLYNFLYHASLGQRERLLRIKSRRLAAQLSSPPENLNRLTIVLKRALKSGRGLRAVYQALDILGWVSNEEIPVRICEILRKAMNDSLPAYRRKSDPQRALMVNLGNRLNLHTESYHLFLLSCMKRAPMYLRIASMRGCAISGELNTMVKTMETISNEGDIYSIKMITDILNLYSSNKERLIKNLWDYFDKYSDNVCCGILGVMTAQKMDRFAPQVMDVLQNNKMYLECRIAAIKYFGAVRYDPVEKVLTEMLDTEDWEYAAVAAKALSLYDCREAGDKLLNALASRNWYVRYNSAMTLTTQRPDLVEAALSHSDRYARDIMGYALNLNRGGGG